ncbi:hypothetical protein ACRCP3_29580, partial [Pseudomonas aeruginosa]
SKIEQKQLNTWVSFQSAEQPLLGQFSVSGNSGGLFGKVHCHAVVWSPGTLFAARVPLLMSGRFRKS